MFGWFRKNGGSVARESSSDPAVTIAQYGTGKILSLLDGATEVFSVSDGGDIETAASAWIGPSSTTGIAFDDGKVGIGTTTPLKILDIQKSTNSGDSSVFPTARIKNTLVTKGNGTSTFNISEFKVEAGNGVVVGGIWASYDDLIDGVAVGAAGTKPVFIVVSDLPKVTVHASGADVFAGSGTAEAGIGGVLTASTTSAQTGANTTETDLWTYVMPANTLATDGHSLHITAFGTLANNGNTKTIKLYFGSTVLTVNYGAAGTGSWRAEADVFRTGAATQVAQGTLSYFNGAGTETVASRTVVTTPAETLSGAVTIKVSGTNGTASAGDIVFLASRVDFLRPSA